jgi:hypothetical protein
MPPGARHHVAVPPMWVPAIALFVGMCGSAGDGSRRRMLGAISAFDGTPRDGRMSQCLVEEGLPCISFDQCNNPKQDLLELAGVQMFLDALCRLLPDSLLWMAPVCSSFVWMNRSGNGRSIARPEGRLSSSVAQANEMAEFVANAMLAATALGFCA